MSKILTIFCFTLSVVFTCVAQSNEITFYKGNYIPSDEKNACYKREIKKINEKQLEVFDFRFEGKVWQLIFSQKVFFENDSSLILISLPKVGGMNKSIRKISFLQEGNFLFKDYFAGGSMKSEGKTKSIFPLYKFGTYKEYYENGNLRMVSEYSDNQLLSNKFYSNTGELIAENVFDTSDKLPEFPGGQEALTGFIAAHLKYPEEAMKNGIKGSVFVEFIITKEGIVEGIQVGKIGNPLLDEAAKDVIRAMKSMPKKWKPAELNSKQINYILTIPVHFRIAD